MKAKSRKSRKGVLLVSLAVLSVAVVATVFLMKREDGSGYQSAAASAETTGIVYAGPTEAWQMLQNDPNVILVDVRTPGEFQSGHLPHALNVELDRLETLAPTMLANKNAHLLVYCHSGNRSSFAVNILQRMGYTRLVDMTGGISAWSQSGYPVVQN